MRRIEYFLPIIAAALIACAAGFGPLHAQQAGTYALGSGDRIQVRAVVWDETVLSYVPWEAVNGTFSVSAEGQLNIPLAGKVVAEGLSMPQLAEIVSRNLQDRVKLVEPPSVTLEIERYRPYYIVGDVDNPGAYEATPGLSVVQAFAVAGGAPNIGDVLGGELRAVLRDTGSLAQVRREQVRARIRVMRLQAELEGGESFEPKTGLSHPDGPGALTSMIAEERAVFDARRKARELESQNLEELKVLLSTEIRNLEAKRDRLSHQIASAREAIEDVLSLGERGLVRDERIRDVQRAMFELESQDFDLQNALFRSQQRIKEADRDILGLQTRLATEVTNDLQRANAQIEDLAVRSDMLGNLVQFSGADMAQMEQEVVTDYYLTRSGAGDAEHRVPRSAVVGPGDILRVERRTVDPTN